MIRYDMIYLLTAIGLTPSGSSTVHIYTQTIHRTTQWNRVKQNTQNGTYIKLENIDVKMRIHNLKIKQKHTKHTLHTMIQNRTERIWK